MRTTQQASLGRTSRGGKILVLLSVLVREVKEWMVFENIVPSFSSNQNDKGGLGDIPSRVRMDFSRVPFVFEIALWQRER